MLIYYSKPALHVSGDVFAHHQEHLTVFTVSGSFHPSCCRLVSRTPNRWQLASRISIELQFYTEPARKLSANLYDIYYVPLLCIQWKTSDDGQRNCPKHMEFHFKNKFEKLVQLVDFIVRNTGLFLIFNITECELPWSKLYWTMKMSPYRPSYPEIGWGL